LLEQDQFIPDQKGKPTQRPTMRRVFQMFEGIHLLLIEGGEVRKLMVLNVQEVHIQIAKLLGEPVLAFYTWVE
jgi:transposase